MITESNQSTPTKIVNFKIKKGPNHNTFMVNKEMDIINQKVNQKKNLLEYCNNNAILRSLRKTYNMDHDDLVSVIIPTYNRFNSLLAAIKSVKNQSYKNIEIIVINDASTQKEYYEKSLGIDIKLINLEQNMRDKYNSKSAHGLTRNEGIKIASGKYIAFLDDDDYWMPEKIQLQLYYLKKFNFDVCSTNYMKSRGVYKHGMSYKKGLATDKNVLTKITDCVYKIFTKKFNYTLTSSLIMKKDIFDKIGMFKLIDAEDWDLWNRMYPNYKFMFIDLMLIYYDLGHAGHKYYVQGYNRKGIVV